MILIKTCNRCRKDKALTEYTNTEDSNCKVCVNYSKKYYLDNLDKFKLSGKLYYKGNKEKSKNATKEYRKNNPDKNKVYNKTYRKNNIKKANGATKSWRDKNPSYQKAYMKNRRSSDILFKLKCNLNTLINDALREKGYNKNFRSYEILGCTFEDFKIYLESKFESWMNWNNKGNWNGISKEINVSWDVDHIIPLDTAKNEEDVIRLNHYTNLQPLCSYTNRHIKRNLI